MVLDYRHNLSYRHVMDERATERQHERLSRKAPVYAKRAAQVEARFHRPTRRDPGFTLGGTGRRCPF